MSDKFSQAIIELQQAVDYIDTYYSTTMPKPIKYQILKIKKNICELELIQNKAENQHIESKIKQYSERMFKCVQE